MSYHTWSEYGYGFDLGKCDIKAIANFLADHCKGKEIGYDFEEDREALLECEDLYEMQEITGDPVAYIIADIMNEENDTNIFAGFQADEADHDPHIGVAPLYPWDIRGPVRTKREAEMILNQLQEQLGANKELENDDFEMEYGG